MTTIGRQTFCNCWELTSIKIPDKVYYIGRSAFSACTKLTTITIPSSVTSIGSTAFGDCENISDVFCYAVKPPSAEYQNAFYQSYINFATLHVPAEFINTYKDTEPWRQFGNIIELEKDGDVTKQCAKPTITYTDGKLHFESTTSGAEFYYTLSTTDTQEYSTYTKDGIVPLSACYDITCYAVADGFMQSETTTATLYWLSDTEQDPTAIDAVKRGITIQTDNGFITISGLKPNESVLLLSSDGKVIGTGKAINGTTTLSAKVNDIVFVKVGKDSIKVLVQ